jgi:hypothetical protein
VILVIRLKGAGCVDPHPLGSIEFMVEHINSY